MMQKVSTVNNVLNAVLFQCCWFLAVFSSVPAAMVSLALMVGHLCMISQVRSFDLAVVMLVFSAGIVLDSLLAMFGVYSFPGSGVEGTYFVPSWLMVLWLAFAMTINYSLSWLVVKGKTFVLACAVAGPLSYLAGQRAGVINFDLYLLPLLMLEWALVSTVVLVARSACEPMLERKGVCHV